jgi:hypothetical protein
VAYGRVQWSANSARTRARIPEPLHTEQSHRAVNGGQAPYPIRAASKTSGFNLNASQGERVLYVTLSESKAELESGAESHGWSLDGVDIYEFAPTEQSLEPEDQYSHFHPSEVEFQDTTQRILDRIKHLQPQRVVFDSLSDSGFSHAIRSAFEGRFLPSSTSS